MASCEKCWSEARAIAYSVGGSTTDEYQKLLDQRKDHPCSPREQAGQFWDEERQIDTRVHAQIERLAKAGFVGAQVADAAIKDVV